MKLETFKSQQNAAVNIDNVSKYLVTDINKITKYVTYIDKITKYATNMQ